MRMMHEMARLIDRPHHDPAAIPWAKLCSVPLVDQIEITAPEPYKRITGFYDRYCAGDDAARNHPDLKRLTAAVESTCEGHGAYPDLAALLSNPIKRLMLVTSLGHSDPWLNGMWLACKCGLMPWVGLVPVAGDLGELLALPQDAARTVIENTHRDRRPSPATILWREVLTNYVRTLPPLPGAKSLAAAVLGELSQGSETLALQPEDVETSWGVPREWVEILADQAAGRPPGWERVWGGFEDMLPAAWDVLRAYCRHAAILHTEQGTFLLAISLQDHTGLSDEGWLHWQANAGLPPLREGPPPELLRQWENLPERLQAFYRQVHNGWCALTWDAAGPVPLEGMWPVAQYTSQAQCWGEKPPRFDVNNLFYLTALSPAGDYVFIDSGCRGSDGTPTVVKWDHEVPTDSRVGLDLWEVLDERVESYFTDCLLREDWFKPGNRVRVRFGVFAGLAGEVETVEPGQRRTVVRFESAGGPFWLEGAFDEFALPLRHPF